MPKVLTLPQEFKLVPKAKPVKNYWPGSVTIYQPLTLPQSELIEPAIDSRQKQTRMSEFDRLQLPVVLACVEKFELADFPAEPTMETWPISPRNPSRMLIQWIFNEILKVYFGELEIPNE